MYHQIDLFGKSINRTICFTGHRPKKLGGFDMRNPVMLQLKAELLALIEALIKEKNANHFITGGALGTDQAAFWCVHIIKKKYPTIRNEVAIPFRDQMITWSKEQQKWYRKMLALADTVVDVSLLPNYDTKEAPGTPIHSFTGKKMQSRNEYMVDNSGTVIAVFDGSGGGTGNCVKYARKNGGRVLYTLDPSKEFKQTRVVL